MNATQFMVHEREIALYPWPTVVNALFVAHEKRQAALGRPPRGSFIAIEQRNISPESALGGYALFTIASHR